MDRLAYSGRGLGCFSLSSRRGSPSSPTTKTPLARCIFARLKLRPHLFLIGANLLYGANYGIAKIALDGYVPPFAFIVVRVVLALAMFAVFQRTFIREKVDRSDWPLLALCGLFGVAVNQLFFFKGLSMTSEIHASLIMITTPLLVLLMARLAGKERLTVRKGLGILIGAAGLAWLVQQGGSGSERSASVLGDLFVLVNASAYGLYLVLVKPLMRKYHPITVIMWVFFFGMFIVVPVGAPQLADVDWQHLPPAVWGSIAFVVLGTTFLAYLFNSMALRDVNPSVVSVYIYTQPLIAAFIAVASGKDTLYATKLLAGLLIVVGVWLVSRAPAVSTPAKS